MGWDRNEHWEQRLLIKMDMEFGDQRENGDVDGMETRWAWRWSKIRG